MVSYGEMMGPILSVASLFCMFLYFVTTVDSGSLVIDCLASNGQKTTSRLQRLLWSATAGVMASALLLASGTTGLAALQSVSIAMGVLYNVLISVACVALQQGLESTLNGVSNTPSKPLTSFSSHLLDPFATDPYYELCFAKMRCQALIILKTLLLLPFTMERVCRKLKLPSLLVAAILGALYLITLVYPLLFTFGPQQVNFLWALALVAYLAFVSIIAGVRAKVRQRLGIDGSLLKDFLVTLVLWPSVAMQLDATTEANLTRN